MCALQHLSHKKICEHMPKVPESRDTMDDRFMRDHGEPPAPSAARAGAEPAPARLPLQATLPMEPLYAAELPYAYADACAAARAACDVELQGDDRLAMFHLAKDMFLRVAEALGMSQDTVDRLLVFAEERGGPAGNIEWEKMDHTKGLDGAFRLWVMLHAFVRSVNFYTLETPAAVKVMVEYMRWV